jgi:hypothetical protein
MDRKVARNPLLHTASTVTSNYKTDIMSRSIHTTRKDVKGLTKKQVDEQLADPNSDLRVLARKSLLKETVKKNRKNKKSGKQPDQ